VPFKIGVARREPLQQRESVFGLTWFRIILPGQCLLKGFQHDLCAHRWRKLRQVWKVFTNREQRDSYAELSKQVGRVPIRSEDLRGSPDASVRGTNDGQFSESVTIFLRTRLSACKHALQKRPELASKPCVLQNWWARFESRACDYL
jgi:hypothetical protein